MATSIIIGLGELGRIFAGGLLRTGQTVVPVNRGSNMDRIAEVWPKPELVLVAVAEPDLDAVLRSLPDSWRRCVALIQNELLPRDWERHDLVAPTVMSVWFEKKKGSAPHPILPSPVFGPRSGLLLGALEAVDLPARALEGSGALLFELVFKNLYIVAFNIAGLVCGGGTVGELWQNQRPLLRELGSDVLDIQEALVEAQLDREALFGALERACAADPQHQAMGRSAPARLARAQAEADRLGLRVPALRRQARN